MMWPLTLLLTFVIHLSSVHCFLEGIYCGVENCYDVLNVTREATKEEITKAYRRLAKKYHPDVHKTEKEKLSASEIFTKIATAYEILRNEDQRKEYNYMLDNPDEVYRNYYYYYRRKYAPKVDVRIVIVFTISIISAIQYWASLSKYNEAIDYFLTVPKYRLKATEIAKEEGLITKNNVNNKKKNRNKTKEEIKQQEEQILRSIIEEKMEIRGAYSKPTYKDVLWVQLFLLPVHIVNFFCFHISWFYKFVLHDNEYGIKEKEYLIRKNMGLSQPQYESLEDHERQEYIDLELWIKDNYKVWKEKKDEEIKAKCAQSGAYKKYRRWMKKGGPGTISFIED